MGTLLYKYEFKSDIVKEEWTNFLANIDDEIQLNYKSNKLSILINFKKTFHITPYSLKNNTNPENKEFKDFALYLLLRYTNEELSIIASEFHVSIEELQSIKNNTDLEQEYEKKLKLFFEPLKSDYISSVKTKFALEDMAIHG